MDIGLQHQSNNPFAYPLGQKVVRLVVQVHRPYRMQEIRVHYGDKYETTYTDVLTMQGAGQGTHFDYFVADVPVPTRRLKYAFEVVLAENVSQWFGEMGWARELDEAVPFYIPYICKRDVFTVPDWVDQTVAYQIFPERFANGNPLLTPDGACGWYDTPTSTSIHGGDLAGIRQRLDYLHELGIRLIYLTPIFRAGSNHKYDTADYFEIDPQFGTKDDLRALVADAHARGMRVVLDAVLNHCGYSFRPFQDVIRNGRRSRYWDWFFIEGDEIDTEAVNYETFATKLRNMPKLNLAHPEVERYMLKVAEYWLEECDIDGWRLDVANEIDHVFWRKFRETIKRLKPDALIIGEVWHNSLPWLQGDQFDGVMNYPLRECILDLFVRGRVTEDEFAKRVTDWQFAYPAQAQRAMLNLLGSHDTERIRTLAGGSVAAVVQAMALLMTAPGIPMIYYGDEIGMQGGADPLCRGGMVWDDDRRDKALLDVVKRLVKLRLSEPALAGGLMRVECAEPGLLRYVREGQTGERVWVQFAAIDRLGAGIPKTARVLFAEQTEPYVAQGEQAFAFSEGCAITVWR
ncbi:glycoside hydrolase family 13 protein [Alicyclobacillus hesperidum]|uniref:glycoside hydrolase family 13 protein n=1 Tax=Alicyclobacillus hesperidum TaxID=89784 RepID=UPI0002DF457A|nr:glycoside hydrolase family 13 protein [Alicyclobacillus hesperidum]